MSPVLDPFRFVLIAVAGWMNQQQLQTIEYLCEENRILREQLGGRQLHLTDDQRRRLAVKAKGLDGNCWPRSLRSPPRKRCWLSIAN